MSVFSEEDMDLLDYIVRMQAYRGEPFKLPIAMEGSTEIPSVRAGLELRQIYNDIRAGADTTDAIISRTISYDDSVPAEEQLKDALARAEFNQKMAQSYKASVDNVRAKDSRAEKRIAGLVKQNQKLTAETRQARTDRTNMQRRMKGTITMASNSEARANRLATENAWLKGELAKADERVATAHRQCDEKLNAELERVRQQYAEKMQSMNVRLAEKKRELADAAKDYQDLEMSYTDMVERMTQSVSPSTINIFLKQLDEKSQMIGSLEATIRQMKDDAKRKGTWEDVRPSKRPRPLNT
jgi:chromosome segregation ATPase